MKVNVKSKLLKRLLLKKTWFDLLRMNIFNVTQLPPCVIDRRTDYCVSIILISPKKRR